MSEPGSEAEQPEQGRSLRGILADAVTKPVGDRDWNEICEEAWAAAAEEKERFSGELESDEMV
jgi:hypothetical protein